MIQPNDYTVCPHCGGDRTAWHRATMLRDRITYRQRDCGSCNARYRVVVASLDDNRNLLEALVDYHELEAARSPEPKKETR
jgi:transcription elongation factor Elf1